MPILDLQRRLHEAGRIRIGHQVPTGTRGARRPERLKNFRLTSSSRRALEAVAAIHGGTVAEWKDAPAGEQWELYTEAAELPVIVPPGDTAFSQSYELWSAGGCVRRCDGARESLTDGPCLCDPEERECKPHTRLSVMLVGVPGVGLWRIDTQGWYAAHELQGAYDLAQLLAQALGRSILPGRLRVEQRTVKRPDPKKAGSVITRNFAVPILDFDVDVAAVAIAGLPMHNGTAPLLPAAPAGLTPIPALPAPSLQEQFDEVDNPPERRRRSNSPPPLPRTGLAPRPAAVVPSEPSTSPSLPAVGEAVAEPAAGVPAAPLPPAAETPVAPSPAPAAGFLRALKALFDSAGIEDQPERLAIAAMVAGRTLASSRSLMEDEAAKLAAVLEDHIAGRRLLVRHADGWRIEEPAAEPQELGF